MTMIDDLGIVPIKFDDKEFEVQLPLSNFHAQPQGFLNGAVSLALAEISAGMASNHLLSDDYFALGQNITAEHLQAKKAEGQLNAQGQLLHQGRSSHVWDIRIYDESQQLISHATVTNHIVKI